MSLQQWGHEAYTARCVGCVIEPRNGHIAGAETVSMVERNMSCCRYARHGRPAGVGEHITRRRITSESGRSRVWPSPEDAGGPHREGDEPKPMMHGRGKSGLAVVAEKPANVAEQSAGESGEPRAGAEGNAAGKARAGLRAGAACHRR